jgi:hypothetical protein
MLFKEITVFCYDNTLCGKNPKFLNVNTSGTSNNHFSLKG